MKYSKKAISIVEQIDRLRQRGLIIKDTQFAKSILSNISYYRLRAYTYPFQDNTKAEHPFTTKISLEQIIRLYNFDEQLRLILFFATETIEISLRTQTIHTFSMKYGGHWQLNPKLYKDHSRFEENIESLKKEINRSREVFIKHYKDKYNKPTLPPSWMSLEVASMGLLSKTFRNLKMGDEKKAILSYYGLPKIDILENWMHSFSTLRNICAHHGRVWNRRLQPISIPKKPTHPYAQNIPYENKVYAYIVSIIYLLDIINPQNNFRENLISIIKEYKDEQILKDMGFATNWRREPIWNNK